MQDKRKAELLAKVQKDPVKFLDNLTDFLCNTDGLTNEELDHYYPELGDVKDVS